MNNKRIIVYALLVMSRAFLCAQSTIDSVASQLDKPVEKKLDRAMLLELAKAMAELKSATIELKEVKLQAASLLIEVPQVNAKN